jgi:hypothetical protein
MPDTAPKSPWVLARCAQAAVAAAAVTDVFRAVAVRAHRLHPDAASLRTSGQASMVFVYLMTVAVVLFLLWFVRLRRTAELLSPGVVRSSTSWAVWSWLIPVMNFWAPRHLVLEVHRASGSGTPEQLRRDVVLVNVWWAAWVGHVLVGAVASLGTSLVLLVVVEALELAAGALAIVVVQRLTARQTARGHGVAPMVVPCPAERPRHP